MALQLLCIAMSFIMAGSPAFARAEKNHCFTERHLLHETMGHFMVNTGPLTDTAFNSGTLKKRLMLSDEQVESIDALLLIHKNELVKFEEDLSPKSIKLTRMLLEYPVNLDEIRALVMTIALIHGEMRMSMIANRRELENVLTFIQRVQFKLMHESGNQKIKGGIMNSVRE